MANALIEAIDEQLATCPKDPMPIVRVEDVPSVFSIEAKPIDWVLPEIIPAEAVTLITAAAGVGKTFLALAVAGGVASGGEILGRRCKRMPVLYLDRENGSSIVRTRLEDMGVSENPDLHIWGMWCGDPPGPDAVPVIDFARRAKPLIIVDSLVAFNQANEQDATETRRFMHSLRRLASDGATVLVLHHTGKAKTSKDYRGSSDLPAAVDAAYVLERSGDSEGLDHLTLRCFKMRMAAQPSRLAIRFAEGRFVTEHDPYVLETVRIRDCLRNLLVEPKTKTALTNELATAANVQRTRAASAIAAAIAEGEIRTDKGQRGGTILSLADDVIEVLS